MSTLTQFMTMTTYQVFARGGVSSAHRTEAAAIRAAKAIDQRDEPSVRMVVESGTYQSRTTVWPAVGATVSN